MDHSELLTAKELEVRGILRRSTVFKMAKGGGR